MYGERRHMTGGGAETLKNTKTIDERTELQLGKANGSAPRQLRR